MPAQILQNARQDARDIVGILTFVAIMAAILGSFWLWH